MGARKPVAAEPYCHHSGGVNGPLQPMSACVICKDSPTLAAWKADWAAWLEEHPDSPEARWVREHI